MKGSEFTDICVENVRAFPQPLAIRALVRSSIVHLFAPRKAVKHCNEQQVK